MDVLCEDFMEMSINDVSDLLLDDIVGEKDSASALLRGVDRDGNLFELSVSLKRVCDDE